LLQWYQQHARDLPWRHTSEPYPIWLSEIMLQQTQVKTVLPRYTAWLQQFPHIQSLAAASLDDVLKAWEGLGYYRRARFLHAAAKQICQQHDGVFPHDFDAILALPGIGRSTAGAIASFCFQQNTPVLDGNVKRVLKRWHNTPTAVDKCLWQQAQQAMDDANSPALWNQAMMELGATLCTPKQPKCATCPMQTHCQSAFQTIHTDVPKAATKVKDVFWQVRLHQHPKKGIWLQQRPEKGIWAGLWTPPIIELNDKPEQQACHIHLLTHRRIHLYSQNEQQEPTGQGQWVQDISTLALPTGIHHLLQSLATRS